jgi:hypothetical protein
LNALIRGEFVQDLDLGQQVNQLALRPRLSVRPEPTPYLSSTWRDPEDMKNDDKQQDRMRDAGTEKVKPFNTTGGAYQMGEAHYVSKAEIQAQLDRERMTLTDADRVPAELAAERGQAHQPGPNPFARPAK